MIDHIHIQRGLDNHAKRRRRPLPKARSITHPASARDAGRDRHGRERAKKWGQKNEYRLLRGPWCSRVLHFFAPQFFCQRNSPGYPRLAPEGSSVAAADSGCHPGRIGGQARPAGTLSPNAAAWYHSGAVGRYQSHLSDEFCHERCVTCCGDWVIDVGTDGTGGGGRGATAAPRRRGRNRDHAAGGFPHGGLLP